MLCYLPLQKDVLDVTHDIHVNLTSHISDLLSCILEHCCNNSPKFIIGNYHRTFTSILPERIVSDVYASMDRPSNQDRNPYEDIQRAECAHPRVLYPTTTQRKIVDTAHQRVTFLVSVYSRTTPQRHSSQIERLPF